MIYTNSAMTQIIKDKIYFFLKRPNKDGRKAKSFSILKKTIPPHGKPSYQVITHTKIDLINSMLHEGTLTYEQAEAQFLDVIERLYHTDGGRRMRVHNSSNRAVLEKYWKDKYAHRRIKDLKTMKGDYARAIEALGTVSILEASQSEMEKQLGRVCSGNIQRRRAQRLNELLNYLDRGFQLIKEKEKIEEPKHLLVSEILKVIPRLGNENLKLLCWTLFGTGARLGEAFAITPNKLSMSGQYVLIDRQRYQDWSLGDTKRGKHPKAPIVKEAREYVKQWALLPEDDKKALRFTKARDSIQLACKELFPNNPRKWLTFHDLRHCYAIHLAMKGLSISQIARAIGDTEDTVRKYYAGFVMIDEEAESMALKLN